MATSPDLEILDRLFDVIESRKRADPQASYTARLFAAGPERIAQKLGEEAVELAIAAAGRKRAATLRESADLLYHLLVLWADAGIAPAEVAGELAKRRGVSGLDEKAARGAK